MVAISETGKHIQEKRLQWIAQFASGRFWLTKLTSHETRRKYLRYLQDYCLALGKNPDKLLKVKDDGERAFFSGKGDCQRDIVETTLETYLDQSTLTLTQNHLSSRSLPLYYKVNPYAI